jgi:spore germination protein GerM
MVKHGHAKSKRFPHSTRDAINRDLARGRRDRYKMSKLEKVTETAEQKAYRENVERIADNIGKLSDAVVTLLKGPLKRKGLLLLLAHSSGQNQRTVDAVIFSIETMRADWLK